MANKRVHDGPYIKSVGSVPSSVVADDVRECVESQNTQSGGPLPYIFRRGNTSIRGITMRKSLLIGIGGFLALGLMFSSAHSARDWDAQKNAEEMRARVLEKYDRNANGVLDPDELKLLKEDNDAIIKATRERVQQRLERYDLNKNGRIDPEEREMFLKD
jgi:hypothetical protein